MFIGAAPARFITQILDVVPFDQWGEVRVCCSGSFRPEMALHKRHPGVRMVGNDVSLLSCAIGEFAVGRSLEFRFKDKLAILEEKLDGLDQLGRVAGVLVAQEMAQYTRANPHSRSLFAHYLANFEAFLGDARKRVETVVKGAGLSDFFAGDFRVHAARAIRDGAGVLAFPPTFARGYERVYKFLHENVEWSAPEYQVWKPAYIDEWVADLHASGIEYCVLTARLIEGDLRPAISCENNSSVGKFYGYTSAGKSSLRITVNKEIKFQYRPVDPSALRKNSKLALVRAEAGHLTFLKNRYLKKTIRHTAGRFNYLVMLDETLVGGITFDYSHNVVSQRVSGGDDTGDTPLYLLSDFAINGERRLAKLVSLLTTCFAVVRDIEKATLTRFNEVQTTVFTDRPVSMKYRGVFDLSARMPGKLRYASKIRPQSPEQIYADWFRQHWKAGNQNSTGADLAA